VLFQHVRQPVYGGFAQGAYVQGWLFQAGPDEHGGEGCRLIEEAMHIGGEDLPVFAEGAIRPDAVQQNGWPFQSRTASEVVPCIMRVSLRM